MGTGSRRSAAEPVPVPVSAPHAPCSRTEMPVPLSLPVAPGAGMPGIPFRKTHIRHDAAEIYGEFARRSETCFQRAGSVSDGNSKTPPIPFRKPNIEDETTAIYGEVRSGRFRMPCEPSEAGATTPREPLRKRGLAHAAAQRSVCLSPFPPRTEATKPGATVPRMLHVPGRKIGTGTSLIAARA